MRHNNAEKQREYVYRNMAFIKQLPYSEQLCPSYTHIVVCFMYQDRDWESAWKWSKELEERAGQHHHVGGLAAALMLQGGMLNSKGEHKNALLAYQKSLELHERMEIKHPLCETMCASADKYLSRFRRFL